MRVCSVIVQVLFSTRHACIMDMEYYFSSFVKFSSAWSSAYLRKNKEERADYICSINFYALK